MIDRFLNALANGTGEEKVDALDNIIGVMKSENLILGVTPDGYCILTYDEVPEAKDTTFYCVKNDRIVPFRV